jgi:hypothetical protein
MIVNGVYCFDHRHGPPKQQAPVAERGLRSRLKREEGAVSDAPELTAPELIRATRYRRSAAACGVFAANALSPADRALLLRMQRSWLERAQHEDLLDDLPPRPPAGSNALAVPKRL